MYRYLPLRARELLGVIRHEEDSGGIIRCDLRVTSQCGVAALSGSIEERRIEQLKSWYLHGDKTTIACLE